MPSFNLILILDALFNYNIKILKFLYNIININNYCFTTYYLHYKEKSRIIKFIYNFFLLSYCLNYYHYLMFYLIILLNLLFITYIIKKTY